MPHWGILLSTNPFRCSSVVRTPRWRGTVRNISLTAVHFAQPTQLSIKFEIFLYGMPPKHKWTIIENPLKKWSTLLGLRMLSLVQQLDPPERQVAASISRLHIDCNWQQLPPPLPLIVRVTTCASDWRKTFPSTRQLIHRRLHSSWAANLSMTLNRSSSGFCSALLYCSVIIYLCQHYSLFQWQVALITLMAILDPFADL